MHITQYAEALLGKYCGYNVGGVDRGWDDLLDAKDFTLDTHCGVMCARIIDRGADLLSVMHERDQQKLVVQAIVNDILVICLG